MLLKLADSLMLTMKRTVCRIGWETMGIGLRCSVALL